MLYEEGRQEKRHKAGKSLDMWKAVELKYKNKSKDWYEREGRPKLLPDLFRIM